MGMTINELVGALEYIEAEEPEDLDQDGLNGLLLTLYTKQREGSGEREFQVVPIVPMEKVIRPKMGPRDYIYLMEGR